MDYVIVITALLQIRMERALKRESLTRDEILKRMDLQWSEEEKIALSDFVIHNDGTEKDEQPEIIDESENVQTSRAIFEDFSEEYPEHIHKKYPIRKKVSPTGHFISPLLKDVDRLKQAIILKEVLDKPRALKRSIR